MFWPRSKPARGPPGGRTPGAISLTARTAAPARRQIVVAVVGDRHRVPPAKPNPSGLAPAGDRPPQVDRLAGDQIGRVDMRPRAAPPITGPGDDRRAVGKVDARPGRAKPSSEPHWSWARGNPTWPRYQPSDRIAPIAFTPGRTNWRYVIGLHLEALAVFGEPGSQLRIADPRPVDERLVDPVGSGIKPRAHDREPGHLERPAHEHRRSLPGGGCSEDSAGSIHSADQSPGSSSADLEHARRGPVALPEVCPHLYLPSNARPRTQGRPRVLDEHAVGALHPAGVPAVVAADPVGSVVARALRKPPREARPTGADPDRVAEVFDAQPGRRVRQPDGARRACRAPDRWPERTDRS